MSTSGNIDIVTGVVSVSLMDCQLYGMSAGTTDKYLTAVVDIAELWLNAVLKKQSKYVDSLPTFFLFDVNLYVQLQCVLKSGINWAVLFQNHVTLRYNFGCPGHEHHSAGLSGGT